MVISTETILTFLLHFLIVLAGVILLLFGFICLMEFLFNNSDIELLLKGGKKDGKNDNR